MEEFGTMGVAPIAITPDGALSPDVFWASLELPFPVLTDADGSIGARYGAVVPETERARRMTTVIDRGGLVLMHQTKCPTQDALFAVLRGADQGISLPDAAT